MYERYVYVHIAFVLTTEEADTKMKAGLDRSETTLGND